MRNCCAADRLCTTHAKRCNARCSVRQLCATHHLADDLSCCAMIRGASCKYTYVLTTTAKAAADMHVSSKGRTRARSEVLSFIHGKGVSSQKDA